MPCLTMDVSMATMPSGIVNLPSMVVWYHGCEGCCSSGIILGLGTGNDNGLNTTSPTVVSNQIEPEPSV